MIGIGVADTDGQVLEVNRALCRMLGYSAAELTGQSVFAFVHPDDAPGIWTKVAAMTAGEIDHVRLEKPYYRKDGVQIWTELVLWLVRDPDGAPHYLVAMIEDTTERRAMQSRLRHQAEHDPLTGLPNRALFFRRLTDALRATPAPDGPAAADPAGSSVGVCYLDLDGFKGINDTLGHDAGDRLLTILASRLRRALDGPGRTVARMGGDEFVLLVERCAGVDDLVPLANRALEQIRIPLRLLGREILVTASAGIIACPLDGRAAAELMQAADTTMYWAKRDGRDRSAAFDPQRHRNDVRLFELAARMPGALERGEFELVYQPLVGLADGRVLGVEALARWLPAEGGLLGPDTFIPIAEETGMIVALGRYLLRRACRDARRWQDLDPGRDFYLSVNISGRQLREPDVVEQVRAVLEETGWPARSLLLELTESDLMSAAGRPAAALQELSELGVRIAIDDFGTGYSNLAYLHRLPVDVLKLAGSFVTAGEPGPAGRSATALDSPVILAALIDLAHALGLSVVAESVETREQADHLRSLGCDVGQGWLLSAPLRPDAVPAALDRPFGAGPG